MTDDATDDDTVWVASSHRASGRRYHCADDCRRLETAANPTAWDPDTAAQWFDACQSPDCYGEPQAEYEQDYAEIACPKCGDDVRNFPKHVRACDGVTADD